MRRRGVIAGAVAVSAVLGATSVAWACTAQLGTEVKPGMAGVGAAFTVEGDGAPGPVEIRWDGADGQVLGIVPDGTAYAAAVRVPETSPGVHTVVAVSREADGTVTSSGKAAIEVLAPGGARALSPASLYTSSQPAAANGSQMAIGAGLLGAGLVALFGGFAVVEVRRRKALAR